MPSSPPSKKRLALADALVFFTIFVWSVNFSVVKFALAELPPRSFNAIRFLTAAVVLTLLAWRTKGGWRFERRHLPALVGVGLLGNTVYQLIFIYGVDRTTANHSALILGTVPAWVALFGTLAGVERVSLLGWVGVALSFAGIALIVLGGERPGGPEPDVTVLDVATPGVAAPGVATPGVATPGGDLLVLLSTLCWAAYTLLSRPVMAPYGALRVSTFCTVVGAFPLVLIGLPELAAIELTEVSTAAWAATVFSGLFAIAVAYVCWIYGVARLGSARTSFYSNLTPPMALLTAWLWLGETLNALQGIGALVAVAGVVLARRHARARAS